MDAERWAELRSGFDELVELDPVTRAERLASLGATHPDMRQALEELLAADAAAETRLARVEEVFGSTEPVADTDNGDVLGLVGQTVTHFRILAPLAAGGMGVVYRAEDTHLGRTVALKFPLPHHHVDAEIRERFLREPRAAGALDHPNLCSIYEAGETPDGQLFLAMPLYSGETLRARLARAGSLPTADTIDIAMQVLRGLGAAHRARIIHRDLKPANIMLLPDGGVKILDFGLARATDVTLTRSGTALGTPSYMAPEQVRGEASDGRTDLWALGVLLYEMLTGRRPFEGEHPIAVTYAIMHSEPVRPSSLRSELGAGLDALVQRLLSKERTERYASAESVAAALSDLQERPLPRVARRASRFSEFVRGRRRTLAVAAVLAVSLPAVSFGAWLLLRDQASAPADPRLVAVLPFHHRNEVDSTDYVAASLGDAFASQLARLRLVSVPGARSIVPFVQSNTPLPRIAQELGSAAVVRGRVQVAGTDVRLDIELYDAQSDGPLQTRSYRGPRSGLIELQRSALQDITDALGIDLTAAERAQLARVPTPNAEAYELYLQGRGVELASGFVGRPAIVTLQRAQSYYARARELDPDFAEARARLALTHLEIARTYDRTPARRDQARLEAEAALRLAPGLPEAHEALARYWSMQGDEQKSFDELTRALAGMPNSSELHLSRGMALRALGRWEEAVGALEQAIRLDPRNVDAHSQAATTYSRLRRYEDGIRHWNRVIELGPSSNLVPLIIRAQQFLRLTGEVDSLESAIARIPPGQDDNGMTTWSRWGVLRMRRRPADALAVLDSARHAVSRDQMLFRPVTLLRATLLDELGQHAAARSSYEAARVLIEDSVAAHPDDASMRIALALSYAGLGRKADATREARRAMELVPLTADNPAATAAMGGAVEVFILAGEHDAALQLLELLFAIPAGREVSVPLLRVDPTFDPLRSDPRFQQLIERFSSN